MIKPLVIILLVLPVGITMALRLMAATGAGPFIVTSPSMAPAINTGDAVIVNYASPGIRIGDTILFKIKGRRTVHRVISITQEGGTFFKTKGDANSVADSELVEKESVEGKVVLVVPKFGYFLGFTNTLPGVLILLACLFTALVLWVKSK